MAEYMNVPYLARRYGGREPKRLGLAHPSIAPYGVFQLNDGEILISIQNDREWKVFCDSVLHDSGLASDPRFDRNTARVDNREVLDGCVQQAIRTLSLRELCHLLDEVRIAYGRVSDMAGLAQHASATTATVMTPEGSVEILAPPVIVNGARPTLGKVPALGEHDAALRGEFGRKPMPDIRRMAAGDVSI
jgi:crotonobetainyl-CoA:carnitine CoA-transferase CaiB-like acyl-CoA transferase